MARSGGTMSILNTFVSGNPITADGHNQNNTDIAAEITNSLALDGQSTMTGVIKAANGSASAPSYTFGSDTNSGFYRIGADNIGVTLNGSKVGDWSTTGLVVTGTLGFSGDFAVGTTKFTVAAASGNTVIAGTAAIAGDVAVATNKFTVASASGNTVVAGTLTVAGTATFTTPLAAAALASNSVTTAKITDANVTTAKIADGAITAAKLATAIAGAQYGPKAWVTFTLSGTTVTVQKSFNVTSVVRNSTGDFTITLTNATADAYYVPVAMMQGASDQEISVGIKSGVSPTSTVIRIVCRNLAANTASDPTQISLAIFGN